MNLNKLALLVFTTLLLSGCTLNQVKDQAAKVTNPSQPTPTTTQVTITPDPEISVTPVSQDSSLTTIEKELNSTDILEEDFSDL